MHENHLTKCNDLCRLFCLACAIHSYKCLVVDIDECAQGLCTGSLPDVLCLNTYGSYHCFGVNFGMFAADGPTPAPLGTLANLSLIVHWTWFFKRNFV